ncbi:hypothetical protein LA080_011589 [Diaporthe eres]|nr:hypothetical protein LA080_011589 [Diaporthe eres]
MKSDGRAGPYDTPPGLVNPRNHWAHACTPPETRPFPHRERGRETPGLKPFGFNTTRYKHEQERTRLPETCATMNVYVYRSTYAGVTLALPPSLSLGCLAASHARAGGRDEAPQHCRRRVTVAELGSDIPSMSDGLACLGWLSRLVLLWHPLPGWLLW